MIPVARHLPLRRKPRRFHPKHMLLGLLIGASFVAGYAAAAVWLAHK